MNWNIWQFCILYQVRVWSTKKMECTNVSSPTAFRKRITAPNTEYRRSASHERATTSWDAVACTSTDGKSPSGSHSPLQPRALDFGTPESAKKRGFALFQEEALDTRKSPEAQMNSPSSVLSPPPSLKRRTIRDYFASSASWIWHCLTSSWSQDLLAALRTRAFLTYVQLWRQLQILVNSSVNLLVVKLMTDPSESWLYIIYFYITILILFVFVLHWAQSNRIEEIFQFYIFSQCISTLPAKASISIF